MEVKRVARMVSKKAEQLAMMWAACLGLELVEGLVLKMDVK